MSAMIIPLPSASTQVVGQDGLRADLRRAQIRVAQLENSLREALRDNHANFKRARDAERLLEELRR